MEPARCLCRRARGHMRIDGRLDEPDWLAAQTLPAATPSRIPEVFPQVCFPAE